MAGTSPAMTTKYRSAACLKSVVPHSPSTIFALGMTLATNDAAPPDAARLKNQQLSRLR
jgi:hypothetical protein